MTARVRSVRRAGIRALFVLGLGALSSCTWKEGDGKKTVSPDAGAGGSALDSSTGPSAGGRRVSNSGGSGVVAAGGARNSAGSGGAGSGSGGGSGVGGVLGSGGTSAGGAVTVDAGRDAAPDAGPCAACPTGVCAPSGECAFCLSDVQCDPGHVCSTGQCLPSCGNDGECTGSFSCCGTRCADLTRDYRSCGGCDVSCTATEFCAPSGCAAGVLSNVCDSPRETFLLDGLGVDDPTSALVRDGLVAGCPASPALTTVVVNQTQTDTIHPVTGRPVVGSGDMQVVLGGPLGQHLIHYLEDQGVTRVYFTYDSVTARLLGRSADGGADPVIVVARADTITASHDFFLIETVVDPATGTLTLALYGLGGKGTVVAAWYFLNEVLPNRNNFNQGFYIYEWTARASDAGDPAPGPSDSFKLIASGS